MTMITPSYLGETIEYSSLHACRSTLEDPTCSEYQYPAGLPITLQLGRLQSTELSASSVTESGKAIEHCAFDSHSYRNPNGEAQEYGRWALRSAGAVVLIPREPLIRGAQYSVSVTAHGRIYAWTFRIAG